MPLLTSLLILIVTARLLGSLFARFSQPAIVGEMLAGVLLGPSLLNLIQANQSLHGISELAVFFVIFAAGLEMNFKEVTDVIKGRGAVLALLGFFLPLFSGLAVGWAFELDVMKTIFLGLCISITALPVTVRILSSFNLIQSSIARYSVAAAIINDLAALLALGIILGLPKTHTVDAVLGSFLLTSTKMLLLGVLILGIRWIFERLRERNIRIDVIAEKLIDIFGQEALFGLVAVFVLAFASLSEVLGYHFVLGAFFGALLIDRSFFAANRYVELEKAIGAINTGFLSPLFFAYLGLEFDFSQTRSLYFVATVLVVSVASKVLAGWLGGRILGLQNQEALGVGIILNGRGVMELVVAQIALKKGFIEQGLFSTLVLMGVFTTLITPMMFKRWILPMYTKSKMNLQGGTHNKQAVLPAET